MKAWIRALLDGKEHLYTPVTDPASKVRPRSHKSSGKFKGILVGSLEWRAACRPLSVGCKSAGRCRECHAEFKPVCNAQVLCKTCGSVRKRERDYRKRLGNRHAPRTCAHCEEEYQPSGGQRKAQCPSCREGSQRQRRAELKMYGLLVNALDPEKGKRDRRERDRRYRASGKKNARKKARRADWSTERRQAWNKKQSDKRKAKNPGKFYATKHKRSVKGRIRKRFPNATPENIEALTAIRMMINNEIREAGDPTLRRIK